VDVIRHRLSVEEAMELLSEAVQNRLVCLRATGLVPTGTEVVPSRDHVLDLSTVVGRGPRTNASLAMAVIETWPGDPAVFIVELEMISDAHPCPCCGHLTFDEPPGSYSICDICFWEDDAVQLRWPTYAGGANKPSLIESQQNFLRWGAMEERFVRSVRHPSSDEATDDGWRTIDAAVDNFEGAGIKESEWPEDLSQLYWWRPTFWREPKSQARP
jgi:hypothetical protein